MSPYSVTYLSSGGKAGNKLAAIAVCDKSENGRSSALFLDLNS
jgi:hypothetical protein